MASMLDVAVYSSLRPSTTTTATKTAKLDEEEDDELIFDQYEEEVTEEEDESVVAKEQIEEKSNDDELEYLTNSLIMFIVDSRQQPIQGRSILTVCHKPSYLFDRFVTKLTAEAFALSGGDYSMSLLPLDYNCPKSSQCETARRLKSKIEKCMQEHSNVLTRVVRQRQRTTTRRRSSIIKKPQQSQIEQQQQHQEQRDDHNHNESQSYHGYGTTTTLTTTSTTLKTKKFSYTQPHPVSSDIDYEDVERRSYHHLHHHHHQSDCQFLRILDGPVLDARATSNKSSSSTQIVIDVYLLAECCYLDLLTSSTSSSSHHSRHLSSNNSSCSISCSDLSSILNHPPLLLIQPFNSISNTTTTTTTTTSSLQSDCSGASQCCTTSTYSLPSSTFELLERWTISMITSKKNDDNSTQSSTTAANSAKSLLKVNELFQAIRSYLHFSQISSWISQQPSGSGQQQLPPVKNIAYSISWRQTNENDLTTTTATRISEEKKSGNDCTSISGTVNEDETIKCEPSQPLPSAEFDAQTFPILNLLFANNKLVLSQQQQQQQQQSQSQSQSSRVKSSLAISQIRIDLESRKRSFFSNTTTLGIPSLVCLIHPPKPIEETLNLTTMNKTAPVPIQSTPSTITSSSFWSSLLVSPDSPSTQTLTPGSYTTTTTTTATNNSNHIEKESKNEAENDEPRTPTKTTTTSLLGLLTPASTPSQKQSTSSLVLTTPTQFPGLITAAYLFASPPPQSAASLQPPVTANSSFNISQSPKVLVSNHQLLMLTTADDMKHLNLTDQNNNRNNEANHNSDLNRLDKVNISAEKKAENGIKPQQQQQQQQININKRKQLHLNLNPPHNDCNINANVDISWPQPQQQTNGSHHHHHNHHYNHHYNNNNNHHHQNNDLNNMSHNNDKSSKSLRIDCSNVDVDIDNNANNVINMIKPTGEQEFVVAATNQNRESSTNNNNNNNNKHLLLKKPEQESTNDVVQTTQLCNRHHASTYSCFPSVVGDGDNNSSNNSNCSSSSSNKQPPQPQQQQQQQPVKPKVINKSTRCYFQLSSSPAPLRKSGSSFDFDNTLKDPKSIKNALTLNNKCTNNIANNNAKQSTTNGDNNSNSSSRQVIISAAEIEKETTTAVAEKKTVDENEDRIIESGEQNGDNENENHHHELSEYMIDDNSSVKTMKHQQHNSSNNSQHRSLRDTMHKSSTIANLQFSYSNTNLASSMPITPNCLLGSFEESLLNGRMNPVGIVDGFYAEIGASGAFFPEHVTLPVYAAFYQVCEDVAASPYLGIINLNNLASKRGYRVPTKGTIQVTLFNPNKTVVKMFVVMYDLSDMPASHRTFLRQRTMYVPLKNSSSSSSSSSSSINSGSSTIASNNDDEDDSSELKSYLRYLIHLRFSTSKSGKLYLHTNVKLIFARNKCEIDPRLARYEYKTFTEAPNHPKYSPKR